MSCSKRQNQYSRAIDSLWLVRLCTSMPVRSEGAQPWNNADLTGTGWV